MVEEGFREEVEVGVAAPAGGEDAAANARAAGGAEEVVGVEFERLLRSVAVEELFPAALLLLLLLVALLPLPLLITVLARWLPFGREEVEMCAVRAPEGVTVVVTIAAGAGVLAFLAPRKGSWPAESRVCSDGDDTGLGLEEEEGEGEGDL